LDRALRIAVKKTVRDLGQYEHGCHEQLFEELTKLYRLIESYEPSIESAITGSRLTASATARKVLALVRAEWKGEHPNDLTLIPGQIVEVTNRNGNGWWEGEWNGQRGLFPVTFVDVFMDGDEGGLKIDEVFEIVHRHDASRSGELSVAFGDVVYVSTITGDWCNGYLVFNPDQSGRFPLK
jgi:hypothetical protein